MRATVLLLAALFCAGPIRAQTRPAEPRKTTKEILQEIHERAARDFEQSRQNRLRLLHLLGTPANDEKSEQKK